MANFGNQSFTGFKGVNLQGSTLIRVGGLDTFQGTIAISGNSLDGNRAWSLPNKNGVFPIMGTFAVQLPTGLSAGTNIESSIVTVTGITAEDGLVVFPNKGASAGYGFSASTSRVLIAAEPGAGNITLTFYNNVAATGYVDRVYSYVAVR